MEEFKQVTQHLIEMLEELDTHFESMTQDESEDVDIKADKNAHEPESSDPIAKIKKTIAELKPADYGVCLICGEPIRLTNKDSVKCLGCGQILPHQ